MPNSVFIVGADTAKRILDKKYYGGTGEMLVALAEIKGHGCQFAVRFRTPQLQSPCLTTT